MIIDRGNRICDCRKALLNGHRDCQYPDITTTFTNFNSFLSISKRIFAMFWNSQMLDKNTAQVTRNMEMNCNNLMS